MDIHVLFPISGSQRHFHEGPRRNGEGWGRRGRRRKEFVQNDVTPRTKLYDQQRKSISFYQWTRRNSRLKLLLLRPTSAIHATPSSDKYFQYYIIIFYEQCRMTQRGFEPPRCWSSNLDHLRVSPDHRSFSSRWQWNDRTSPPLSPSCISSVVRLSAMLNCWCNDRYKSVILVAYVLDVKKRFSIDTDKHWWAYGGAPEPRGASFNI